MKKLIFTAALAVAAFTSNAQWNEFFNSSNCDLRIRTVCIDETTCSASSTGTWVSLPATTNTTIPGIPTCAGATVAGYEIDYDLSTGCSGNPLIFSTNATNPCPWNPNSGGIVTSGGSLAPCDNCNSSPGQRQEIIFVHSAVDNYFHAH